MPSFLNDENSPIFQNHSELLDLDPNSQFGVAAADAAADAATAKHSKVHGGSIQHHPPTRTILEPFDETSNSSIHDSEVSDAAPMTINGNGTRPTSMSSLTNGRSITGGTDHRDAKEPLDKDAPNPLNGTSFPDRTVTRRAVPEVNGIDTTDVNGIHPSSNESRSFPAERHHDGGVDSAATLTPTKQHDGDISPKSPAMLSPSSPTSESGATRSGVHRYSSPPVYQAGASGSTAGLSAQLQPPTPGSLRQRHTLEVPKANGGRSSKDGLDTAQASGRFSPTTTGTGRRASLSLARRTTRSMQLDTPRDEVVPDEDALRWTEAYRQKRASKRKRKEEEEDDRVVVGTKVDETHANWVTAYNMLTGIRVSVSRTNAKLDREVTDEDFDVKQKSTFDM
jgi:1-phosphatidylinositol-4-phosphate 5-kinase